MIVVVASRYDAPARRLAERWAGDDVCLLTPADLSAGKWRYRPGAPLNSTVIAGGREVKQSEISGVMTRLQWVWESELLDIVQDDRAYVAAEMSAFLLCWLDGLTCPTLNRPTPNCLAGPGWRTEQWAHVAAQAGMRVRPIRRLVSLAASRGSADEKAAEVHSQGQVAVTVVGEQCFGEADETLLTQARRLASLARVQLLSVQFSGPDSGACFLGATACPDVESDATADAIHRYLHSTSQTV